ncbi:MAG TPA: 6-phospho-beta-glucosidase [Proteobacteria bacterium]|nr:6-phospho-beta-glucosidase [Pseudomonadota bacterium]
MKIAVIGGGSTYTPELVDGLIDRWRDLGLDELVLYDINPERMGVVADFCRRMAKRRDAGFEIVETTSLEDAVRDAGFVLTQIRVGGQEARHRDITLGLKYGLVGQETVGVGGFAKALRTIPEMLKICEVAEQLAPQTCIVNFTNPSGIITEAIVNHSNLKCVGLCNIPIEIQILIARFMGAEPEDVELDYIGLNHLGWIRRVSLKGQDITGRLFDMFLGGELPANIPDLDYDPWLIKAIGMFPTYYLRYYFYPGRIVQQLKAKPKTRAEEVMEIERRLLDIYRDPNRAEKPPELSERGGAFYSVIAVLVIESVHKDLGRTLIVNTKNAGAIPDLPDDCAVEVPSRVDADGAHALYCGPLPEKVKGLVQSVKAYERLTIQAAVNGDYDAALCALMTNPLGPTAENAKELLDELLTINGLWSRFGGER